MPEDETLYLPGIKPGMVVCDVRKGIGSMFTMAFKEEGLNRDALPNIWVYLCAWGLWHGEELISDSITINDNTFATLHKNLEGKTLLSIRNSKECDVVVFELFPGYKLELLEDEDSYGSGKAMFMVFSGVDYKISYIYPGGLHVVPGGS
jgi:hypothetical protein